MSKRTTAQRRPPFDRHWAYPDPAALARQELGRSRAGRDLCRRIADGDPLGVWDWVTHNVAPFELFHLLDLGLGGAPPTEDWFASFDEVPVATLAYRDACGSSDTLYARRTGRGVAYRVWDDGFGDWTDGFDHPAPLTRLELRRLLRDPPWLALRIEVETAPVIHDPDPVAWDPGAVPTGVGRWEDFVRVASNDWATP
jgi:hypothetical protein